MTNTYMIPFGTDSITAFEREEQLFVAVRPICDRLGLAWKPQFLKLTTDRLRYGVTMMVTPSAGGMQDMLCLPKGKLFGWLNSIHPSKVSDKARPALLRYQAECDAVLDAWWSKRLGLRPDRDIDFEIHGTKAMIELTAVVSILMKEVRGLKNDLEKLGMHNQALVDYQSTTAFPTLRIEPRELEFAPADLKRAKLRSSQRITKKDQREIRVLHEAGFSRVDIGRAMNMTVALVRKIARSLELFGHIAPDPQLKRQRKQLFDNLSAKPRPRKSLDPQIAARFAAKKDQAHFAFEGTGHAA